MWTATAWRWPHEGARASHGALQDEIATLRTAPLEDEIATLRAELASLRAELATEREQHAAEFRRATRGSRR